MRKLAAFIVLAIVVPLLASHCGDGGEPATTPALTGTTPPTEDETPESGVAATGKIAFTSNQDGDPDIPEIYFINADGTGLTRLAPDLFVGEDYVWSPDGSRIAFEAEIDLQLEIYVMDADGIDLTNLTNNDATDGNPAWSPDGMRIAFVSSRDGNSEIYVVNADGSGLNNLTDNPADDFLPAWSPDSSQIAFVSQRDGDDEIYIMNADGSNQTNLTANPEFYDSTPAWSPAP